MPIWRQPNGKIYRNPLTCKVVNCDTSPCGVMTICCDVGLLETYVFEWTSATANGETGAGGTISIIWNGTVWYNEATIQVPNGSGGTTDCFIAVQMNCESEGAFFTVSVNVSGQTEQSAGGDCAPLNIVFAGTFDAGCGVLNGCSVHA